MENKTEQQEVNDTSQEIEQKGNDDTIENKPKSISIWLAVLVLLCLNAGLYWQWYQQKTVNGNLTDQLAQIQVRSERAMQLEKGLQQDFATTQQQITSLQSEQKSLADNLTEWQNNQPLTNGDVQQYWALAEVEYLLNSANQRVLLAADVAGAKAALSLADDRINALSDYRLHPLRALVAEELLALASVAHVDIDGMALQLQTALDKVDNLQVLMAPEHGVQQNNDAQPEASTASSWKTALLQAWQQVRSLVVIRHQQDGAAAVLVPEQRYFLYQNLRLQLESARFALLSGRESVFQSSLSSAEQWLQQYFVGAERDALLDMVRTLKIEKITIELPDISGSLLWLQQQGSQL